MTPLQSVAVLLSFAAVGGYINHRMLHLPSALGTTVTSVGFALVLLIGGHLGWFPLNHLSAVVRAIDLQGVFLHGILSLMLFAGALFVDGAAMRKWAPQILSLATFGLLLATAVTAGALWLFAHALHFQLPFLWCLAFGALIAPTDPIAACAIVRKMGAPKSMVTKLVGESLFNDGTGVMLFLLVMGFIATLGSNQKGVWMHLAISAGWEPVGGILVGLVLGAVALRALVKVDHYPLEVLITLALATGSYGLAEAVHASAPIATVIAGLMIGTHGRTHAMSDRTREHLDMFWETLDELLNAALFALMGLEMLTMPLGVREISLGVLAWACVLVGRWVGVALPLLPFGNRTARGTIPILTWGGLRGGISLALALGLPNSAFRETLVAITFVVVMLSSIGQGLTLAPLIERVRQSPKRAANSADNPDSELTF
jgi:CPA1 family monovalent cation:H+ antiporter